MHVAGHKIEMPSLLHKVIYRWNTSTIVLVSVGLEFRSATFLEFLYQFVTGNLITDRTCK